jgi:hypothetical protein
MWWRPWSWGLLPPRFNTLWMQTIPWGHTPLVKSQRFNQFRVEKLSEGAVHGTGVYSTRVGPRHKKNNNNKKLVVEVLLEVHKKCSIVSNAYQIAS